MTQVLTQAVLNYDSPNAASRRWFAWRPFGVSLLLGLAALACWRALPHVVRIQETIGATNRLANRVPPVQALRWTQVFAIACGPLVIGVMWGLGDHSRRLRLLRRPAVCASLSLPMLAIAAMAYVTFAPLVALDRQLSIAEPHTSNAALPMHFDDAHGLYTYLAYLSGEPTNSASVDGFISGCEINRRPDNVSECWVIAPTYNGAGGCIRGATGNGDYYIVKCLLDPKDHYTLRGFDLVGIASGNSCTFTSENHETVLETWWHNGMGEGFRTRYRWENSAWQVSSSAEVKIDPEQVNQ